MLTLKMYQVDAFTDELFKGNPAAVVLLDDWLSAEQMQQVAAENNLSETAFIKQVAQNNYQIRWFTPTTEVPFCGHATLASAFTLFYLHTEFREVVFTTEQVGELLISKGDDGLLSMDFPNRMPSELVDPIPQALLDGLKVAPSKVLRNQQAYFVIYDNEQAVISIKPDNSQLTKLGDYGVAVTAPSNNYDFISRFFAPNHGIDEDPVTGSIHTGLAPYWAKQLNKTKLTAYQASARGGKLFCEVQAERVMVKGQAVLYSEGVIYLPE